MLGGAEDHRLFTAPAVRIAVTDLAELEESADRIEFLGNQSMRFIDLDPGKDLDIRTIATIVINRVVDLQAVAQAGEVVIMAMARGGVDTAGAGFEGDMLP